MSKNVKIKKKIIYLLIKKYKIIDIAKNVGYNDIMIEEEIIK